MPDVEQLVSRTRQIVEEASRWFEECWDWASLIALAYHLPFVRSPERLGYDGEWGACVFTDYRGLVARLDRLIVVLEQYPERFGAEVEELEGMRQEVLRMEWDEVLRMVSVLIGRDESELRVLLERGEDLE
jgi:hypothetical protein